MTTELPWVAKARSYIGLSEKTASGSNTIFQWVKLLGLSWFTKTFKAQSTPWCGVFVAHCLSTTISTKLPVNWMRAKDWGLWGQKLSAPVYGCIAVFERTGGGHVAFVIGTTKTGNLVCLGGNQSDKVCIAEFDKKRNPIFVYPKGQQLPTQSLNVVAYDESSGGSEA